jgi:subtilisin family serine protease
MSFAGPSDPKLSEEIASGSQLGVVFIASVCNEGKMAEPLYPAADENVIAVTATDEVNGIFKKANHCSSTCVAALGVDVVVAALSQSYQTGSGTSLAAAQGSGVVALLRDAKPDLTPKQVRELLFKAVKQISPTDPDEKFVVAWLMLTKRLTPSRD